MEEDKAEGKWQGLRAEARGAPREVMGVPSPDLRLYFAP